MNRDRDGIGRADLRGLEVGRAEEGAEACGRQRLGRWGLCRLKVWGVGVVDFELWC